MKRFFPAVLSLAMAGGIFIAPCAQAAPGHHWRLTSPNHEQTFSYGTETNRVWKQWGRDNHLALLLSYTNDPFVDRQNPRQYDNFRFDFPQITLSKSANTFVYHTSDGRSIPVSSKKPDFFGIDEVALKPNAFLIVDKPHGYLTVSIRLEDPRATENR